MIYRSKISYRMYNKRSIGNEYENKAVQYLKNNGYSIIERNFYSKQGEIDIIAKEGEYLVFVEVKYRSSMDKGHPVDAVNFLKKNRIIKTAKYYMYKKQISEYQAIRFDVIALLGDDVKLIKDAFWVE